MWRRRSGRRDRGSRSCSDGRIRDSFSTRLCAGVFCGVRRKPGSRSSWRAGNISFGGRWNDATAVAYLRRTDGDKHPHAASVPSLSHDPRSSCRFGKWVAFSSESFAESGESVVHSDGSAGESDKSSAESDGSFLQSDESFSKSDQSLSKSDESFSETEWSFLESDGSSAASDDTIYTIKRHEWHRLWPMR